MTAEIRNRNCLELRTARPADLTEVLPLLGRAQLPTAGVAEALFLLTTSAEHYFPRFGGDRR